MVPHPMSSYEARRATFVKAEGSTTGRATSSRRAAAASHTRQPSWPHPLPDGSSSSRTRVFPSAGEMANLGLYYVHHATSNASSDATASAPKDACALYPEEHVIISDWRGGDNPAERIREIDPNAAFLLINDSKDKLEQSSDAPDTWMASSAELLPTGKTMIDARVRTFSSSWPYDGKKGWKPTSRKLAQAGFHYTPNEDEDDCATCQYCDVSLGGWEKTDDPVHEHQRRRPECAFFNCTLKQVSPSTSNSTVKGKAASGHKRTKSASTKRKAAEAEEVAAEPLTVAVAETVKAVQAKDEDKGNTTTSSKRSVPQVVVVPPARTSSRKKAKVDDEEIADDAEEHDAETQSKNKLSMPQDVVEVAEPTQEVEKAPEKPRSSTHDQSKTKPVETMPLKQGESRKTDATIKSASVPPAITSIGQTEASIAHQQPATPPVTVLPMAGVKAPGVEQPAAADAVGVDAVVPALKAKSIAVEPLLDLPPLMAADEELTVEAWLKQQVKQACDEMEREGMRRIESLREAMKQSRVEIEAVLRGQPTSASLTPIPVA